MVAASEASKEGISMRSLLQELSEHDDKPMSLAVDNQSAIAVAYNPEHHSRMKHVERRHFFVRECVENQQLVSPFVNTHENLADFFTNWAWCMLRGGGSDIAFTVQQTQLTPLNYRELL